MRFPLPLVLEGARQTPSQSPVEISVVGLNNTVTYKDGDPKDHQKFGHT